MWVRSTLAHGVQACLIGRGSRVEVQHFVGICCSGIWNVAGSGLLDRKSAEIKGKRLGQKTEFDVRVYGFGFLGRVVHTRREKVVREVGQVEYFLIC